MKGKEIRLLKANEIECRVGIIKYTEYSKGLSLLLYKDARADMKVLDETYGPLGWKRSHQEINGSLYCTVEIWDDGNKQWVCKQDVGTTSYSQKEKGEASDSFKRACVSVGIGRELYTAPFIWIPAGKTEIKRKTITRGGRPEDVYYTEDKFRVQEISYSESREITDLLIVNQKGDMVYKLGKTKSGDPVGQEQGLSVAQIMELARELDRKGVSMESVLQRYGLETAEELTQDTYRKAMKALKKTGVRAA